MDSNFWLPLIIPLISFVTGGVIFFIGEEQHRLRTLFNLIGAAAGLVLVALLVVGVTLGEVYEFRLPLLFNIDLVLHADTLSLLFVTLSSLLWVVTTIYAVGYLEKTPHRSRFFGFFSLCVGATLGIALAGNLVTFLIFYELLTIVTYPLVVHRGNPASLRAGRIYLTYTIIGGTALLVGVVWLKSLVGSLDFETESVLLNAGVPDWTLTFIFVLLIAGLGVKAALVPLHGWLPEAMAAPAPVSALLHAVAVVKAGAFGIIRVVQDVYGIELAKELNLLEPLVIWAGITILYGSMRALSQNDLKKRLAFSTVSQVSYIALGVAIATPLAIVGGMVHLVHQGLMKITLFFCAGVYAETLGIHRISEMNGVGRRLPLTTLAFTVACLGMIGVPPIAGFVSKWYLAGGALSGGYFWVIGVLLASSMLNAAYFLPILYRAWFVTPDTGWRPHHHEGAGQKAAEPGVHPVLSEDGHDQSRFEAKPMLLFPPVLTALLALFAGLMAGFEWSPLSWAMLIAEVKLGHALPVFFPLTYAIEHWLVLLAPLAPLFAACLMRFKPGSDRASVLALLSFAPALLLVITGPVAEVRLPDFLLGARLALNEDNRWWLLLTVVIWSLGLLYNRSYMKHQSDRVQYWFFLLLAGTGNLGLVLAQNAPTFLTFFAMMGFSSYGLVVFNRSDAAFRAGRWYIRLAIANELLAFTGLLTLAILKMGWFPEADADLWGVIAVACLVFGFGVKAGLMPLHIWLPLAHPMAPTPASAILSGAMIKAGVIGWFRFIPEPGMHLDNLGDLVILLGIAGSLVAALWGCLQREAKAALAYSSVSQMGLLAMLLGLGMRYPAFWSQASLFALVFALHHAINKVALFFTVGVIQSASSGAVKGRLLLPALVPMLGLAGAPFTSGLIAKGLLKQSVPYDGTWHYLGGLLVFGSFLTSLLMLRYAFLLWRLPLSDHGHVSRPGMLATWLMSILLCSVSPFLLMSICQTAGLSESILYPWSGMSLVPVLLALLSAGAVFMLSRRVLFVGKLHIPPGDLATLLEWLAEKINRLIGAVPMVPVHKLDELGRLVVQGLRSVRFREQIAYEIGMQVFFLALTAAILYGFWHYQLVSW